MTIKINFGKINGRKSNENILLLPDEINEKIIANEISDGEIEFLIPFKIDIKRALEKNLKFEIEILSGKQNISDSLINYDALNLPDDALGKLKSLPGQRNNKTKFIDRVKNRQAVIQRDQGMLASENSTKSDINRAYKNRGGASNFDTTKSIARNTTIINNVIDGLNYKTDILKINSTNKKRKIKLDYTRNISNRKAKLIKANATNKKTSDTFLFGTKKKYILGYPRNPGINFSSAIPNLTALKYDTAEKNTYEAKNSTLSKAVSEKGKKSKSNKKVIQKLYTKGRDPAAAFEGIPSHRSVKTQKKGTKPKIGIKNTGKKFLPPIKKNGKGNNTSVSSLKGNVESLEVGLVKNIIPNQTIQIREGEAGLGSFNLQIVKPPQDFPFVYEESEIARKKVIYLKYQYRAEDLVGGKVYMQINGKNTRNLNIVSRKFRINAKELLIEQFLIPENFPKLSVINLKDKNFAKVTVSNRMKNRGISYELYRKTFSPDKNYKNCNFIKVLSGKVKKNSTDFKRIKQTSTVQSIYRLVFTMTLEGTSIQYSNYVDDFTGTKNMNRSTRDVNLFASINKEEKCINVHIENIPADALHIKLLKCVIGQSIAPNRFKKMSFVKEKNTEENLKVTIDDLTQVLILKDYEVFDGRSYEYQLEMELENGTKIKSNERTQETYYDKEGAVTPIITNGFVDKVKLNFSGNIELIKPTSIVDKMIDSIKDASGSDAELYKNELSKIKSAGRTKFRANIILYNLTTGKVDFIGDFDSGDGFQTPVLTRNCRYVIKTLPYEFSPTEITEKITRILNKAHTLMPNEVMTKFSAARVSALSSIKSMKNNVRTIKKDKTKFFTKRARKRGTLQPPDITRSRANSISKTDIVEINYTGDTSYLEFDTFNNNHFRASPENIYVSPYHNVLLQFNVEGQFKKIDFYIITAKKEGSEYPIGSAHCLKNKRVSFLDYTNFDYLGVVDYFVRAVFEDGDISDKFYVGRASLISKFDNLKLLSRR